MIPLTLLFFLLGSAYLATPAAAYDMADNAILHQRQGQLFYERRRYREAVAEFQIALQLNPTSAMSASLFNNLGMSFMKTGQYTLAIASFQRALRLQPSFLLYYQHLTETYKRAKRLGAYEQGLLAVLERNPKDSEAWVLLGFAYEHLGEPAKAQIAFDTFIRQQPNTLLAKGLAPKAAGMLDANQSSRPSP